MTTATLQTKMTDIVARLDKACGKSFIGENQKCTKTPVQSKSLARPDNAALRRNLLTGVGLAVTGVVLGAIAKGYSEIKESGLPDSAITPKEPPKGYYDSLTPGDLLYRTFPDDVFGVTRAHYAVYAGRDAAGEHTVLHATTKYDLEGNEVGSHVKQQTIKDYNPETSFKKAERSDPSRKQTTTAQLHRIIKDLEGKDVTWNGFTENCESFARAVSNDLPVATQSKKVNPVTRQIVRGILNLMYPGMEGKGKLTNKDIVATVNKSKVDSMNPKAQAAQISPLSSMVAHSPSCLSRSALKETLLVYSVVNLAQGRPITTPSTWDRRFSFAASWARRTAWMKPVDAPSAKSISAPRLSVSVLAKLMASPRLIR
jgi:hypothetical protein